MLDGLFFDGRDWYWIIDSGGIYSSRRRTFVGLADPEYLEWVAAGGQPTACASDGDLVATLERIATDAISFELRPPTAADVVAERSRRLSVGFDFDFGDARGVHRIGTTDADMTGWREVQQFAGALVATGAGLQTINIITDTGLCVVTADEWQDIMIASAEFRQPIWSASFALQMMDPIPIDFQDDSYWP